MSPFETHCAGGVNARPLHGDGDAVEEDNDQHNVVKQLVGDDLIAQGPEPDEEHRKMWNVAERKMNLAICMKQQRWLILAG